MLVLRIAAIAVSPETGLSKCFYNLNYGNPIGFL
jgi:hypothetical protein